MGAEILSTASVSRILGITTEGVRYLERAGKLRAALRTDRGQRLFLKCDVDQFAAARDAIAHERAIAREHVAA